MTPFRTHSSALSAMVAVLAAGSVLSGCADQSNPVLPPTDDPGGVSTSSNPDAATAASEAGHVLPTVEPDAAPADATAADVVLGATCNLLQPDCPAKSQACYPINGAGHCEVAGSVGVQGWCTVDEFPPTCDRGLTCIAMTPGLSSGWCLIVCNMDDPAPSCGFGNSCHALPAFPTTSRVGYCVAA